MKTLMYDYYNVMKQHYKNNIIQMYTDTDNIYISDLYKLMKLLFFRFFDLLCTDDFYFNFANSSDLLNRMDMVNFLVDHPCYIMAQKKTPGFFSDETNGKTIVEFVALGAVLCL